MIKATIAKLFKRQKKRQRSYDASAVGRLFQDWATSNKTADEELRVSLNRIRARARELTRNNDYAKKYMEMVKTNVVGSKGIVMQSKAKSPDGSFDALDNQLMEDRWKEWGKRESCTVTGNLTWVDVQRLVVESVARDGEILIRKVESADNPFGFSLELIEADHLQEDLNKDLQNGNRIRMSVEINKWRRPVNYWLLDRHPGESITPLAGRKYQVVPANEIIHLYRQERPSQARGVSWMVTAMTRLHQIGEYEEAELISSRASACKMGFFKPDAGGAEGYLGDDIDSLGNTVSEASPGAMELLPPGMDFQSFDPTHPAGNFAPFMKTSLRGIASGLNVAYNSLASDLEGVNFSSIRSGVLEERQNWRVIQNWMVEHFCQPVYSEWLKMSVLRGALGTIPPRKVFKFENPKWQPRGWEWVDPVKDANANGVELGLGLKTRADILSEKGMDIEEVFNQLKAEEQLAEQIGISIGSNANDQEAVNNDTE